MTAMCARVDTAAVDPGVAGVPETLHTNGMWCARLNWV